MTEAETNYTTTEKNACSLFLLSRVCSYLIIEQELLFTGHTPALKYRSQQEDAKARLLDGFLLLQRFGFTDIDTKGGWKKLSYDHLSRLENPTKNVFDPKSVEMAKKLSKILEAVTVDTGDTYGVHFTAMRFLMRCQLRIKDFARRSSKLQLNELSELRDQLTELANLQGEDKEESRFQDKDQPQQIFEASVSGVVSRSIQASHPLCKQ
ncbi:hypothetical protein Tco_1217260 [Tanacetum coccineum]